MNFILFTSLVTVAGNAQDRYILRCFLYFSACARSLHLPLQLYPPFTTHAAHDTMFPSKFSASTESFSSSASSPSSASVRCECPECEQVYPIVRRPFFRRSLPSQSEPQHHTLPSQTTLQKQQAQMLSMGYSKVFTLGYLSVTVSPFHYVVHLRSINCSSPRVHFSLPTEAGNHTFTAYIPRTLQNIRNPNLI